MTEHSLLSAADTSLRLEIKNTRKEFIEVKVGSGSYGIFFVMFQFEKESLI